MYSYNESVMLTPATRGVGGAKHYYLEIKMARGKKAKISKTKVVSRQRMLGDQQVFPIRCVSRRKGMRYDIIGGFSREGRDISYVVYDGTGRPVPFKNIGKLV